jgi:signal transduction histidine kinase
MSSYFACILKTMAISKISRLMGITALLIFISQNLFSGEMKDPLHRPVDREILNNYRKKSDEYVLKNLNRFALDRLWIYDQLLDSLYKRELTDTIASIESRFRNNSSETLSSIASLKKQIDIHSKNKAELEKRYSSLLKYSIGSFIIWLGLVLLFIRLRQRKMVKEKKVFDKSSDQLESMEQLSERASKLFAEFSKRKEQIRKLEAEIIKLENAATPLKEKVATDQSAQKIVMRVDKLRKTIDAENRIVDSILSQASKDEEVTMVDINAICDAYLEIVFRGTVNTETFNLQVTRDFEKKLPGVAMNPSAVGTLLLNVLSNAFESVKEKSDMGIKGYQPKVSISTRILPKFLQVRIKDNGTGMNDKLLQTAGTEFFSTRTIAPRPGLGLSIAKSIIENHKGELKIESEEGNSTDVYIKFYLK